MEAQKIVNLLNEIDDKKLKFATKKWYTIDSESKGSYTHKNEIKFLTNSLESNLCDYSDTYILVTGDITVTTRNAVNKGIALNAATQAVFKNCAPFKDCRTETNDTFVDYADFINITMPMYNLIEYSDNYSDTLGGLWAFKRDEIVDNANVTNDDNAPSFKYKANIIDNTENNGTKNGVKIFVQLKYLSNVWRLLEMPLINCKVYQLSLYWIEKCVLTAATNVNKATFKITDAKLYVPMVILSAEDSTKLSKLLGEGFKRSIYQNKYKVIDNEVVSIANNNEEKYLRELLDSSYQ